MHYYKLCVLKSVVIAVVGIAIGSLTLFANSPSRGDDAGVAKASPNMLLIVADDWGLHAGVYGTRWINTPNYDALAKNGLLFRNAYTSMAKCAPSRAILLTGRHLWQNEEAGNHLAFFPTKLKTWPEVLTEQGWLMGYTGKGWGPGIAKDENGKPRSLTGKAFSSRTTTPPTQHISSNDYAANFADFLDSATGEQPWCFWCGFLEPHRSYEFQSGVSKGGKQLSDIDRVPSYWPDEDTVRHDMLDYAFEVEHVDRHLGAMIQELKNRGLFDNTLIVVTSDHGMPFPRVKGYAYHDSNHVPLALSWPAGIVKSGRVIDDFIDFTDLAPTLLDLAHVNLGLSGMLPITGQSLRPILESELEGQIIGERDHVLIGKERTDVGRPGDVGYPIRGIVNQNHLYLRNYEPTRWPAGNPETGYLDTDGSPTKSFILELGRGDRTNPFWIWNFGFRPAEELYDLQSDPDCVRNLAEDAVYSSMKRELQKKMESKLLEQEDPRMLGNGSIFDKYPVTDGTGFYERYLRGEKVKAGWVEESDFEVAPVITNKIQE